MEDFDLDEERCRAERDFGDFEEPLFFEDLTDLEGAISRVNVDFSLGSTFADFLLFDSLPGDCQRGQLLRGCFVPLTNRKTAAILMRAPTTRPTRRDTAISAVARPHVGRCSSSAADDIFFLCRQRRPSGMAARSKTTAEDDLLAGRRSKTLSSSRDGYANSY